jgi:hypothetical protein
MLSVIGRVDGFHAVDLMTAQRSFNSEYFMNHVLEPTVAKTLPRGEFHISIDYNFA